MSNNTNTNTNTNRSAIDRKNRNINKENNSDSLSNTQVSSIKFMENNIGTIKDDKEEFNNQRYLIRNNTTPYLQDLNYQNNIQRERDNNEKYNEQVSEDLRNLNYRINNSDVVIDGINLSNKLVYPKTYDNYIEYLENKSIRPIDTVVLTEHQIFNFDSDNAIPTTDKVNNKIKLLDNSLEFTNNSDILKINFDNSNEEINTNDLITLNGISNSRVNVKVKLIFKNDSSEVIIDNNPNFLYKIGFLNIFINFNFVTEEKTFQNIPLQVLNRTYNINIKEYNGQLKMYYKLPITFYSDSVYTNTFEEICTLTFFNIGNYPTNLLNSGLPQNQNNLLPFLNVYDSNKSGIKIKLKGNMSINNNFSTGVEQGDYFFTGSNVTLNKVYFNNDNKISNEYYFDLGKNINNVCSISVISSEIPNTIYNITNLNNKFYWNNLSETNLYTITLTQGDYNYEQLKTEMEKLISKTKRTNVNPLKQYEYNIIEINFDDFNNTSYFKSYNIFYLPQCIKKVIPIIENISYSLIISHNDHNLKKGDRIFITDSLDVYFIDSSYINSKDGHIITSIINTDSYTININNINKIPYDTNITQEGGFSIKIKSPNSISLNFSFDNTFGDLMGFFYVGNEFAITPFSSSDTDYIITNQQNYAYNSNSSLILNGFNLPTKTFKNSHQNYILLKILDTNINFQVGNNQNYFYKFQTPIQSEKYYFNTFVDQPIVINPPLKKLSSLYFSWIYPDSTPVNFGRSKFSLSLKITTINNHPENTLINDDLAKI